MKLDKLEEKAEKASQKTQKARDKLPKKRRIKRIRTFDESTGKAKKQWVVVTSDKKIKSTPFKKGVVAVKSTVANEAHKKISQVEEENSAIKAAHKTEQVMASAVHEVRRHKKTKLQKKQNKVKKLQKKEIKENSKYQYKKFMAEHPEYDKNVIKKMRQKKMIKKEYAKKLREKIKAQSITTLTAGLKEIVVAKKGKLITGGVLGLLFLMLSSALGSCGAMLAGGGSNTAISSYASKPADIDHAEETFTQWELQLQNIVDNIESDHTEYDEYGYNIGPIGHVPFELINYLSAKNGVFTYSGIGTQLQNLFNEMYQLSFRVITESRTRTETRTGYRTVYRQDGTSYRQSFTYEVEVIYEVSILETILSVKSLEQIAEDNLTDDEKALYSVYQATHGGLQQFASPLDLYWYNYVTSFYGYRTNPVTGEDENHQGIDISVPDGKLVYAGMNSTVFETGDDDYWGKYVCLFNTNGTMIKYAHLSEISVEASEHVEKGSVIGKTGHSGSCVNEHLHLELSSMGTYYNPLFYFDAQSATLYGERHGDEPGGVTPPESYDNDAVRRLMAEADRYVGYPYVWGGSNPRTSFDCSGYVCYVMTNSGYKNLPRTTAQGIYNQCTPVSRADAKAGDLIFFTRTYNSGTAVTHVGIYCGDGVMVHCGDPIKYASIDTTYWSNHFYGFGRIR